MSLLTNPLSPERLRPTSRATTKKKIRPLFNKNRELCKVFEVRAFALGPNLILSL